MKLKHLLLLLAFISISQFGFGQEKKELGSWNILNVTMKVNPKWNFFTEAQLRSLAFYSDFHYYELKIGATYKIKPNFCI